MTANNYLPLKSGQFLSRIALPLMLIIGGTFFCYLFIQEYRDQSELLRNHQQLLERSVSDALKSQLTTEIARYPHDVSQLNNHWRQWAPNFYVANQEHWIYPYITHASEDNFASLWLRSNAYVASKLVNANSDIHSETETDKESLSADFAKRLDLAANLVQSLEQNSNAIRQNLALFLGHKEYYRLLPLEEIISTLIVFEFDRKALWNKALVNALLLDGFKQQDASIPAVFDWIVQSRTELSVSSLLTIDERIKTYMDRVNVEHPLYRQYIDFFVEPRFPNIQLERLDYQPDIQLINGFLVESLTSDQFLVIPIDIEKELSIVKEAMEDNGLLLSNDSISFKSFNAPANLSNLSIHVEREAWRQQAQVNQIYLIAKFVSLLLLLVLSSFVFVQYQKRQARLLEVAKLKEDFAHLVSHELKTPLASIRLMAETLERRLDQQLEPKNYPNRIKAETDRLWLMVDNVLSFNRLDSDLMTLNRETFNFIEFVDELRTQLADHPIEITLKSASRLGADESLVADKILLELVLKNMMSNAMKYNEHKTAKVSIEAINRHTIVIMDNGIGIEPTEWENIFLRFNRLDEKQTRGSGLGLALSRRIMQLHGGNLKVIASQTIDKKAVTGTTWEITFQ